MYRYVSMQVCECGHVLVYSLCVCAGVCMCAVLVYRYVSMQYVSKCVNVQVCKCAGV